jgi:hypothetical protein
MKVRKTIKRRILMKRIFAVIAVVAVLSFGALAFAHSGGGYGTHGPGMMGYGGDGHGPGFMGYGGNNRGHMMDRDTEYGYDKETKEFLDKTTKLRKELHEKRFDYMEAERAGDEKKAQKLTKELDELAEKLYAEAPKSRSNAGYGNCW